MNKNGNGSTSSEDSDPQLPAAKAGAPRVDDTESTVRLEADIAQLRVERDSVVDELERADARMQALESKLDGADRALSKLRNQCAAQELRIAELERELSPKKEIIGGFDRDAEQLTELSRRLHTAYADKLVADVPVQADGNAPWPKSLIDDAALFGDDDDHRETVADIGARRLGDDSILADLKVRSTARTARVRMFVAIDDEFPGTEYALDKPVVTIGRARDSDIRLQHLVVSRRHARLRPGADVTVIEDAGSKNGITVNSQVVERATLRNGDIVGLGGRLDFQYVELELPPH